MHFINVFKSSKGALIKEKILWHFLTSQTNFVWLHFHLNKHGAIGSRPRPRAWWYSLRVFTRKKFIWFHLSIKCLRLHQIHITYCKSEKLHQKFHISQIQKYNGFFNVSFFLNVRAKLLCTLCYGTPCSSNVIHERPFLVKLNKVLSDQSKKKMLRFFVSPRK